ncbi:MAG: GTP-binding protein [Bacteroidaceae bacterium]|nr:GTP-binding protein [Bacteroidaceae bacterium]
MKQDITPVLLLTGYLGSGKTTLVNHILTNERNIKFAVIVNDIGEVNIDADLIQKGGIVGQKDDSLVALQNGCICCTLKMDLIEQINDILKLGRFDYIVIEASGICEPEPIAQTICSIPSLGPQYTQHGIARLDCITTVVDALRLQSEFACGSDLTRQHIDEEDIENLIIQQIEFCNIILLNKASEVSPKELGRIREILHALQPKATIIDCDYCNVELDVLLNTNMFDFERVATSATWITELEREATEEEEEEALHGHHHHHEEDEEDEDEDHHHHHHDDDEEEEEHHHHHHPHQHHEEGEAEEYGIGTFVYYRRQPFNINEFDQFVAHWPKSVIRAKGLCYFSDQPDMSFIFEQSGVQKKISESGLWWATAPEEELKAMAERNPLIMRDWDDTYGDRMVKLVFIGQKMDREKITKDLDACLEK